MNETISPNPGKKDLRPLYKKKRFIIPVSFFAFCFIIGLCTDEKDKTATNQPPAEETITGSATTTSETDGGLDLKTKIQNTIRSIDGGDDLTANKMENATSFTIAGAIFKAYAMNIKEGKASTDPEVLRLTEELERKVIKSQEKNFPKLRKAYYNFIKEEFLAKDVHVSVAGNNYTDLTLTNHFFSSEDNAGKIRDALVEMLHLLRFKEISLCAYNGQDDCHTTKIPSPPDDEIED